MTYTSSLIGRFGNQMFQYAHLRALSERENVPFITPDWVGDVIFDLPKFALDGDLMRVNEYRQDQASIIYTRSQVRQWFVLRNEVRERLDQHLRVGGIVAHRRVGDYLSLGYPVVSRSSYVQACLEYGYDPDFLRFVTEEDPVTVPDLPEWLPDFYQLMRADVLFRGNSSFSWWGATLSEASIYSPVIDGLGRGEHDVHFVTGNHPRFCNLPFVTELHLPE